MLNPLSHPGPSAQVPILQKGRGSGRAQVVPHSLGKLWQPSCPQGHSHPEDWGAPIPWRP